MESAQIENLTLELIAGDITAQNDLDAVVNAANAQLTTGGGVAGAIHLAAGPGLETECRPLAPIRPGEAVITGGHDLANSHVIHCLGPVHGRDEPSDALLAACYSNALGLAEEHGLTSIGLPALSTGAFGYPMEPAAEVALRTVIEAAPGLQRIRLVRFVLFSADDLEIHAAVMRQLLG